LSFKNEFNNNCNRFKIGKKETVYIINNIVIFIVTYFVRAITYYNTAFAQFCHVLRANCLPEKSNQNDVGMSEKNDRQLKRPIN
jgi:hypothetical protein